MSFVQSLCGGMSKLAGRGALLRNLIKRGMSSATEAGASGQTAAGANGPAGANGSSILHILNKQGALVNTVLVACTSAVSFAVDRYLLTNDTLEKKRDAEVTQLRADVTELRGDVRELSTDVKDLDRKREKDADERRADTKKLEGMMANILRKVSEGNSGSE